MSIVEQQLQFLENLSQIWTRKLHREKVSAQSKDNNLPNDEVVEELPLDLTIKKRLENGNELKYALQNSVSEDEDVNDQVTIGSAESCSDGATIGSAESTNDRATIGSAESLNDRATIGSAESSNSLMSIGPNDLKINKRSKNANESKYALRSSVSSDEGVNDKAAIGSAKSSKNLMSIGPNGTEVNAEKYKNIKWDSAAKATRQLVLLVFSEETLATHTLSGKPSPAFVGRERPKKGQLDTSKVKDVIHAVVTQFNCSERSVRATITTKCAEIAKMCKKRQQRQNKMKSV